mmetsp:Transcript_7927/g.14679  ORF Transcript_7927/g.14679 Transcript_7927/m.14679 type:complete len:131 (+) Transcript_7927:127-519(+)
MTTGMRIPGRGSLSRDNSREQPPSYALMGTPPLTRRGTPVGSFGRPLGLSLAFHSPNPYESLESPGGLFCADTSNDDKEAMLGAFIERLDRAPPLNMFNGKESHGSVKTLLDTLKQLERRHADLSGTERR